MNKDNDTSRFTIQDEATDIPDSIYVADAENLRLEKLSTRVTLVAVLIPCLLVIVLGVAYLDIKNRVVSTQNTGSMGVQNLAKDLESRFSTLSLKQAKLEAQLIENTKAVDTLTAGLQVKLNKSIANFKDSIDRKANQADLTALSKKTDANLDALKKDVADLNASFAKFDEELADQILLMAQGLKKDQERLAGIEQKALQLEKEKLGKESLNLSLGLERLALQELIKDKIRGVDKQLARMNKKIDDLDQQLEAQAKRHQASSPPPRNVAVPPPTPPKPSAGTPSQPQALEEQTIN